jgi:hypothetical protein
MPRLGLRGFAVVLAVIIMSLLGALFGNTGWVYYIVVCGPGHSHVNNKSREDSLTKNYRSASQESGPWPTSP